MPELSMFAYPWDIAATGPERFVAEMGAAGVDRVLVAACYHSAEVIVPARRRQVSVLAEANVAHLPLAADGFHDLAPPAGSLVTTAPDLFASLARAGADHGVAVSAWTIALHNSDLAQRHPDVAIENCFGDRFAHGLCPANPRARRYALDMAQAIARTGWFDEVMVESLSYLLWSHGHPHELWGVRLDPSTRYLASLCFCDHCLAQGSDRGVDGEALRARVADELHRTWNHPLSVRRADDDGTELASRLVLDAGLWDWTRMRLDVVSTLAASVADVLSDAGVALALSAAVWGRPASLNWTEGVDLVESTRLAGRLFLESYYPDPADVARELEFAVGLAPPERLAMAQTLWPRHHGSLGGLLDKVQLARDAGLPAIALYNYGMAPQPVREWVSAVAELVHRSPA